MRILRDKVYSMRILRDKVGQTKKFSCPLAQFRPWLLENICKGQLITDGLFHPPLPPNHSLSHWQNYRGIFTSIITSNYASIVNADTIHWKVNINAGICLWCQICHRFHNGSQVTNVTLSGCYQFLFGTNKCQKWCKCVKEFYWWVCRLFCLAWTSRLAVLGRYFMDIQAPA